MWPFEERVKGAVRSNPLDMRNVDEMDKLLLTSKPSQITTRHIRIKAFGNYFKVVDESSVRMQTYDSRVASGFQVPAENARSISINYVGVL